MKNMKCEGSFMPTLRMVLDVATEPLVTDVNTKIQISHDKMMQAFGGKSIYFTSDDFDEMDHNEVDDDTFQVTEVVPVAGETRDCFSTLTSVSTITSGSTTAVLTRRNYSCTARRAQDRDSLIGLEPLDVDAGTVVTKGSESTNGSKSSRISQTKNTQGTPTKPVKVVKKTKSTNKLSKPSPKKTLHCPMTTTDPALPDGTLNSWLNFVDNGGYLLTCEEKERVIVKDKHRNTAFVLEAVKFHLLVSNMRKSLPVESARDAWTDVLPPKSSTNFDFCCLFLMVATPNTPDEKIIEVFGPLFANNYVTEDWVIEKGILGISEALTALGRQHMTAKYIVTIAEQWKGVPRDYRSLTDLPGVGAKVALVTVAECYNLFQGVPCNVHMVRIFKALYWMPRTLDEDCLVLMECDKKSKRDDEYELARASIEGWFPIEFWKELNQTYAGLGQLLRVDKSRKAILNFVDKDTRDWTSKWRLTNLRGIFSLVQAYQQS